MKSNFLKVASLAAILLANSFTSAANAGVVNVGTYGSGSNDCTIGCMAIYQQSYDSSLFTEGTVDITDFTLYSGTTPSYSGEYDVFMSYASGTLTTNLEANITDPWSFYSSIDLSTISSNSQLLISGLFNYNPDLGDLIIGYYRTSVSSGGNFYASGQPTLERAYQWSGGSSATAHAGYALNTTFTTNVPNDVDVPEPAPLALLGLGLFGLGFMRRSKV